MKSKAPTLVELARFHGSSKRGRVNVETELVWSCIDWLNTIPHVKAWRQNTGAAEYPDCWGKRRLVRFGQVGQADITGLVFGVRLEAEVKRPGEEPTDEQFSWLHWILENEGISFWCDSLELCQRRLKDAFERKGWKWDRKWES